MESVERINVPDLSNIVERFQGDSRADSDNILSHLLDERLDVLHDSGLRQLIENAPAEFRTGLDEERSTSDVRRVITAQFTENVTFLDNAVDLESGNWTSNPSKDAVRVSGKQKLEIGAMKKVWHCEVELQDLIQGRLV